MLVTHQATRLVLKTMALAMIVGLTIPASAQDIKLTADDFEPKKPEVAETTREDLVKQQIAAGEFGPAIQTAKAATDPGEQADLLGLIAGAQADGGDFGSALGSMRTFSRTGRSRTQQQDNGLLGGAANADFTTLMNLIRQQTRPPALWQQDDGEGGSMSPFPNGVLVEPGGVLRTATNTRWKKHDYDFFSKKNIIFMESIK